MSTPPVPPPVPPYAYGPVPPYGPPYGPPFAPQPPKRHRARNIVLWVVGGLVALVVLASVAGGPAPAPAGQPAAPAPTTESTPAPSYVPDEQHVILYEASNTGGRASVSYTTEGFGVAQDNKVAMPWRKVIERSDLATGSVTVQDMSGRDDAHVGCIVTVDGQTVATNTSFGAYAVVSCSGSTTY